MPRQAALRSVPEVEPQTGMDEVVIDDPEVKRALEDRLALRAERAEVNKRYNEVHGAAMKAIERLELPVGGVVRVGRFRITKRAVDARDVSFTTGASDRITIAVLGD